MFADGTTAFQAAAPQAQPLGPMAAPAAPFGFPPSFGAFGAAPMPPPRDQLLLAVAEAQEALQRVLRLAVQPH